MKTMMVTLFSLLLAGLAAADNRCDYELYVPTIAVEVTENNQVIPWDLTLSRENNNGNTCANYRIFFGKGLANSYQRKAFTWPLDDVKYNLHRLANQAGILKDFGDAASSTEYLEGTAQSKDTPYSSRFYVSIPSLAAQNFPTGGYYYDNVQVSLYSRDNRGNWIFEDTANFLVLLVVAQKIEVSLIDEGSPFDASSTNKTLDFGNMTQYQELGADLRVVSNTPYKVRMSSANNGALKLNAGTSIGYAMKVNGSAVSLTNSSTSPVTIGTGGKTTTSGDRYNLRVQITGATENRPAGLYQDFITISAIAN